ncbi:MAG: hypothetical protein U5L06_10430 [Rhodovibrio sp.]|nr:hypothetical protein [Rhodovibrio sp.]
MHADGYIQLKDRSKDIIISGGENISSIEVEDALYTPPGGRHAAAVVAKPDEKWGETPCAFVELKPRATRRRRRRRSSPFARENLAHFKAPRHVVFRRRCPRPQRVRSRSSSCASARRRSRAAANRPATARIGRQAGISAPIRHIMVAETPKSGWAQRRPSPSK